MENTGNRLSIKKWAEEDRPREKLLLKGKSALSDAELIAILIGSGIPNVSAVEVAKHILSYVGNDLNELAKLSVKDLQKFNGIGEARAISIVSALELGRRRKGSDQNHSSKIQSSRDIHDLLKAELMDQPHEEFWLILLKRNNEVIRKMQVSKGGVAGTVVDAKIIFKYALEHLASSIILVHNHPSGNIKPSQADINLTGKLKKAGEFIDIPVLDHIIFCNESYFSFADESML